MEKQKNEWNNLSKEVESQTLKQKLYDDILFNFCGNLSNKKVLDFGCGTGEIVLRVKNNGAKVKAWDLSKNMRDTTIKKLGQGTVYNTLRQIPPNYFDIVFCNLVICVVNKAPVKEIIKILNQALVENGIAFVGFCNPLSYNISESKIQKRFISGKSYSKEHEYKKLIKEGGFEITEKHRPLEFYEKTFLDNGFVIEDVKISKDGADFIIYKLRKIKHGK